MPDLTVKDAAHAALRRGWLPIQLNWMHDPETCSCGNLCTENSRGKHPLNKRWQETERPSAADIEALWESKPQANLGLATGRQSGFFVLDVDTDKGKTGAESAAKLAAQHGDWWGTTYTVQTGGGGYQFYFQMPDFDVTNSDRAFREAGLFGIDIRGDGGQVVAPPSVSAKGAYSVAFDIPVAPAPEWLLEMLRPRSAAKPVLTAADIVDRSHLPVAEIKRLDAYAETIVKGELEKLHACTMAKVIAGETYSGPAWNSTTFNVACTLLQLANSPWTEYSQADAYAHLFGEAPRDRGFGDEQVNTVFQSAMARIGGRAREIPPAPASRAASTDWMVAAAGGNVAQPAAAAAPAGGQPAPGQAGAAYSPYVDPKDGLQALTTANAVLSMGPLAWGRDEGFWSYANGVWTADYGIVERRCVELLGEKYRNAHGANVATVVQHKVPRLTCDAQSRYMNFRNGMLDWQSGEMLAHSPDFGSTVQFPLDWTPDAECPHFEQFLGSVLSPDYVELAWEMLGYLLYSGNPLQVAFMFHGTGGNGKGTLMRVIEHMLGGTNISSESLDSLNTNRFAAISLFGKIANLAGDIDATYQESTANFKKLTGEDLYYAERKYGARFGFTSWAVPVFSANKIPGSADTSEGYLRRWIILDFARRIPDAERVPGLSDLLLNELPGVVARAVRALHQLMGRKGGFKIEGDVARGKESFAHAIDQVRQWLEEATIQAPEHSSSRDQLYTAYRGWAERNGAGKLKASEFYERLTNIGAGCSPPIRPAKVQGKRFYRGIMAAPTPGYAATSGSSLMDDMLARSAQGELEPTQGGQ